MQMIQVDYKLVRDEKDQLVTFTPSEQLSQFPNLALIEGPNSSGKSTFLHLMALAFGALDKQSVSPALKGKISALTNTEYQELSYDISIKDGDGLLKLHRGQDSDFLNVASIYDPTNDKEKLITLDVLQRKYLLLYDIPEDPIGRLNMLTETIKSNQNELRAKIQSLSSAIVNLQNEINNSQNPETLQALAEQISRFQGMVDEKESLLGDDKTNLERLNRYVNLRLHERALKKKIDIQRELEYLEKQKPRDDSKPRIKGTGANYQRAKRYVNSLQDDSDEILSFLDLHHELQPKNYTQWKEYDFTDILSSCTVSDVIAGIISEAYGKLNAKAESLKSVKIEKEKADLITKIIKLVKELEGYEVNGEKHPISTEINKFIELLSTEVKKLNTSDDAEQIGEIRDSCNQLCTDLNTIKRNILPGLVMELEGTSAEETMSMEEYVKQHTKLSNDLRDAENNLKGLHEVCIDSKIDPDDRGSKYKVLSDAAKLNDKNIHTASPQQLAERLDDLKKKISNADKELEGQKVLLSRKIHDRDQMLTRPVHRLYTKRESINSLYEKCQDISKKLERYTQYLDRIKRHEYPGEGETEYQAYINSIGAYLAGVIGEIQYIDGRYPLQAVDLIHEKFNTLGGKVIRFSDMGTGQGQSAYLLSQLKNAELQNDKKIIALFDEIALMDSNSLEPIKQKLIQLKQEQKLLVGIMVQRNDDNTIVTEIGG
jgi:DNA repair protein SbcC/Rad50